jgi:hypothetical protein
MKDIIVTLLAALAVWGFARTLSREPEFRIAPRSAVSAGLPLGPLRGDKDKEPDKPDDEDFTSDEATRKALYLIQPAELDHAAALKAAAKKRFR